jgi:hypothetical protein
MILLKKGLAGQHIIVTLWESVTVPNPTYVFVFTNVMLKDSKTFTFTVTKNDDLSDYQDRYNKFLFDETLVANMPEGQYRYTVTQLENNVELEAGKMLLQAANNIERNGYTQQTERKGYRG